MNFKTYFFDLDTKERKAFAEKVGTSAGHLRNYSYGYAPLAPKVCVAIEKATQGKVTRQELRDDWASHWPELTKQPRKSRTTQASA